MFYSAIFCCALVSYPRQYLYTLDSPFFYLFIVTINTNSWDSQHQLMIFISSVLHFAYGLMTLYTDVWEDFYPPAFSSFSMVLEKLTRICRAYLGGTDRQAAVIVTLL